MATRRQEPHEEEPQEEPEAPPSEDPKPWREQFPPEPDHVESEPDE